jgi:hypothetical protein
LSSRLRKAFPEAVNSSSVQIEADADGNGSYELSVSKLWTELI